MAQEKGFRIWDLIACLPVLGGRWELLGMELGLELGWHRDQGVLVWAGIAFSMIPPSHSLTGD
jgi:hypothetical protein